ncbi:hypothetical protein PCC6912_39490 [Chlorogloeopsis fritschii PCC 6912]|uniref:Uncharacterized protein n=1 Tax=Chlorogloeopsis fritschii PCC 6912 TaxID=211165 RepID=A0A433N658_CHLFR|nr:hypothetical protein [Chlorogloeopsis fritschii]RUR76990.1 hypothetical protein PCC6912_39490 [Chlorogloeopsis fritschii PCC 6912]
MSGSFGVRAIQGVLSPGYVVDRYYTQHYGTLSTNTAIVANSIRYVPFYVSRRQRFTAIAVEVTTSTTGNARLGIYSTNNTVEPVSLILDAGTIDTGTTGVKEVGIDITLNAGWYALCIVADAAASYRCISSNTVSPSQSALTGTSPASSSALVGMSASFTYGVLPNSAPMTSFAYGSFCPFFWLKAG